MSSLTNNQINVRSMNGLVSVTANSGTFDELDCNTLAVALSATAPTVSALSNDTNVATTQWVTNHAGGSYVTVGGIPQTVTGEKTFSNANTFINNTLTASIISAASASLSGLMSSATATISGILTTNEINGSAVGTSVKLFNENTRTGQINFGAGTSAKNIVIGGASTTLTLTGSTILASLMSIVGVLSAGASTLTSVITNTITGSAVGTAVSLYDEALRTGAISLGTGSGVRNMSIGGVSTTLALTGTVITVSGTSTSNIGNSSGSTTNIGNGSGSTTFTGSVIMSDNSTFGSSSADSIIPNGTLTKPFIIGYSTTSSFSLTSVTPVTTFLGGTLQTTNTFSNSPTGTFRYVMSSITPYDANGGLSLSAGTYMLWFGINFEDTSTFNLTDLRLGLSLVSTLTTSSSEATIVASLPNLTCYFHKTDAGDAAVSDSENRVLSSCFNLASAGIVYPFYDANHSVTMDTVKVDVIITKIGSA